MQLLVRKRTKQRAVGRAFVSMLLALTLLLTAALPAQAADGLDGLRKMEAGIVSWMRTEGGEEQLLAGEVLDGAGGGASDWIAFDISRMGIEDNQAAYLSRLKETVEEIYQEPEQAKKSFRLSDVYRMILTIEACGGDPTAFGTDPEGGSIDLVRDFIWNSIWGAPGDQGINGYIWALIAADSRDWEEPEDAVWTREKLVQALLERQLADGGFGLALTDKADVDLTSMTLTALAPCQEDEKSYTFTSAVTKEEVTTTVAEAAAKAFSCIAAMQAEDGSMLTYGERTSESTSWAMLALASWGRDPETDADFTREGHTLADGLAGFVLPDGGIVHSLDGEDAETEGNTMAGYQAAYALEAVCRLKEGQCRLFDLSDAPTVSEEEIEAAGEKLPPRASQDDSSQEKSEAEVAETVGSRTILITGCVAAAVVLLVILFLALAMKERRKNGPKAYDETDDEDDDW